MNEIRAICELKLKINPDFRTFLSKSGVYYANIIQFTAKIFLQFSFNARKSRTNGGAMDISGS